ncbi:hypothetical protein BDZ91DRAFT_802936 [Kalaharituber pfeilii]|nr:hypothetical protein BDZ91DRAFT_802936 [Kalaharituber pfeilii]
MAPNFSSYLTSPTIRLLPNPPASQPCSDTQYIVHRALLTSQSQYLKKRTRESYILLENTTEETVGLFLEWLYRGDYDVPTSAIDEQEEDAEEEQGPVVQAAMTGGVGVWGKKAAVFGRKYILEKSRSEGLQSQYVSFGQDGEVTMKGATKKPASKPIQLPSPPASPTMEKPFPSISGFLPLSPEFNPLKPGTVSIILPPEAPPQPAPQPSERKPVVTLDSILSSHLAVYVFALRYHVPTLAELSLTKISSVVEFHPPVADTLVRFARAVYYDAEETGNMATLTKGSPLRAFLARYAAYRLEEVKTHDSFKKLLAEGGPFVVDLVNCVMGGAGKGDIWVK